MTATHGHRTPWRLGGTAGLAAAILLGVGAEAGPSVPTPPAAELPEATVTVVGSGGGLGPLGERLPTGQSLAYRSAPGWELPPGVQAGATAVVADGTVLIAGRDHHGGGGPATATTLAIGAYQPSTGAYTTVHLPAGAGPASRPDAPSITGLTPLAGGNAAVFTVGAPGPATGDAWPALGVLTRVDGTWTVAAGDGWANHWTGADLHASSPPGGERACPADPEERWSEPRGTVPGDSRCQGLDELVVLPHSGDLVVAQPGVPGQHNGALLALRLTGPEPDGRFRVTATGQYLYPVVRDPDTGAYLDLTLHDLRADPSGGPGHERFVVGLRALDDGGQILPHVIQELNYDAVSGSIVPISAPTVPGDTPEGEALPYGYSAAFYDQAGNLWAARHHGLGGGKLAVYTATGGAGVLDRPGCPYRPGAPPEEYQTSGGDRAFWGQACRPDYDLLQAQELLAVTGLVQDPASADVVALTLAGELLPIRPSGSGDAMTFQIGNLVETALWLLPPATDGVREHQLGGFDAAGRLWLPGSHALPVETGAIVDQWLYGVDVGDLFDPPPVPLPDVPGHHATIRAGHTPTTGTVPLPGAWAVTDLNSEAYLRPCVDWVSTVDCSFDGLPGNGFVLAHRSGFGHLDGDVAYRVEVPAAGRYRVAYRVFTFEVTTAAAITLTVGDRSHTTLVSTAGTWRTVPQAALVELAAGVHTLRLAPPEGQGGWYLSWFTLQRA